MQLDTTSLFAETIQDHLRLKERNAELERTLPLSRYMAADPFENHPLFKTEEQARLEETIDGDITVHALAWPDADAADEPLPEPEASLWGRSRDFDWGD